VGNRINRVELLQPASGVGAQPRSVGLEQLLIQDARRRGVAAGRQGTRGQRAQPDVGSFSFFLRPRGFSSTCEPGRGLCIVTVTVVNEADVVRILPAVRTGRDPFLKKPNGQVRSAGPARLLLREEEGAEFV